MSLGSAWMSPWARGSEVQPEGLNVYQLVTGDDSEDDRRRWDRLYNAESYIFGKEPAIFLLKNAPLLIPGRALDLAMGEGRNAVFLAKKGFLVEGVDISEVALRKAKRLAREHGVSIAPVLADLHDYEIKAETYHLILNFDYLQRSLIPRIKKGLKRGGLVVFESYTMDQLVNQKDQGIRRDYLLKRGELKTLFSDFEIVAYQELNDGHEAKASLIARKP